MAPPPPVLDPVATPRPESAAAPTRAPRRRARRRPAVTAMGDGPPLIRDAAFVAQHVMSGAKEGEETIAAASVGRDAGALVFECRKADASFFTLSKREGLPHLSGSRHAIEQ